MSLLANSNAIETGGYQISRSVRLRKSASAYFSRTPGSSGNRKTWTLSAWAKICSSSNNDILSVYNSGTDFCRLYFDLWSANQIALYWYNGSLAATVASANLLRDPSAWYHLMWVVDTTQSTASNRVKLYVNGVQITTFSTAGALNYPSQNSDLPINNNVAHNIGAFSGTGNFDGYLTEINFIDGQALTPSSFGETDPITGSWVAKKYTGTYGTNGFYLNFSDNSAATSTTIGKDYSGNGNNWTPNNISVTAGTTYDSMLDVPSGNGYADGGNGRGNYATLNPLSVAAGYTNTFSNGNLTVASNGAVNCFGYSTIEVSSGKWYFEGVAGVTGSTIGIWKITSATTTFFINPNENYRYYSGDGKVYTGASSGSATVATYSTWTTGDVIGVALDMDNGKVFFSKNGVWQGSSDPAAGTNPTATGLTGSWGFGVNAGATSGDNVTANFGQRPFSYTPPTGFKALNTTNLSDPTVKKGSSYFDINLRTGNGSTTTVTGIPFAPDLVWVKARNNVMSHNLFDRVRGAQNALYSNLTDAETSTTNLTAFTGDGYTVGNSLVLNTYTFVDWLWKANGTGVSNTAGSITSTVSANTTSGFAIATTTGAGGTGTIGHGLGAVPQFIMCFRRNTAADHYCYHRAIGNTNFLVLNTTAASAASANLWNNTTPTSTVFSVGNTNNNSGDTYVHYIFAPVPGYSAFGSYTGNGSADGPFVYCGFRPRYVLYKRSDSTGDWYVWDTARDTVNVAGNGLFPNYSIAEVAYGTILDILSNGFKLRTNGVVGNASGGTYIYAAFAENPFKYSNAR